MNQMSADEQLTTGSPTGQTVNNAIATRRNAYMDMLNDTYADNYSAWLAAKSVEVRTRIARKAGRLKHGLATVAPLTCKGPGERCPFFSACPIPADTLKPGPDSDYPINMSCVLEVEYIAQQIVDYIHQLDVDPANIVEMSLLNELALIDLLRNRAVLVLSHGDSRGHGRDMLSIDESIVGWSEDGDALTSRSTKVHPAVDIMDKHEKRRERILNQLVATRASKFKVFGGGVADHSQLTRQLNEVREFITNLVDNGGIALGSQGGRMLEPVTPPRLINNSPPVDLDFYDEDEVIE